MHLVIVTTSKDKKSIYIIYIYIYIYVCSYHIVGKFAGGKFGKFDESSMFHQTKTIQISN